MRRATRTRLFDYGQTGRDQIAWVVERLRARPGVPRSRRSRPSSRSPTRRYIPCVSLLDFWLDGGALELVVYAHSLDFGKKAYGNLIELAHLAEHVAEGARRPASARWSCT